ncbi:MAG: glycosyltransferase [Puniceicoccaceae bacterium]
MSWFERLGGVVRRIVPHSIEVSAIISTYRAERFIEGCLKNLTEQTLFQSGQMEVIVIDSGSPEREGEIARAYQRLFGAQIRYYRTAHETLYGSWNRAIRLARGRYLTNANTDDRRHPDGIRRQWDFLKKNPELSGCYGYQRITEHPNLDFSEATEDLYFGWPEYSYSELQHRCILGPQPMWVKELHRQYGFFDSKYRVVGDYDFWLRCGKTCFFGRVPEVLGLYYRNPGGLEHSSPELVQETIDVRRRHGILELSQKGTDPVGMDGLEMAASED